MAYEHEKNVAIAALKAAARLCEQVRHDRGPDAMTKADHSPVTVADFGAQAVICRAIAAIFPNDPVVGEEDATLLQKPAMAERLAQVTRYVHMVDPTATPEQVAAWINRGNGQPSDRFWTLDPIDGTKGYVRGDQYAIALALIEGGQVVLGLMACPALPVDPQQPEGDRGVLFLAARGEGAHALALANEHPHPIRVNAPDSGQPLRLIESVEVDHGDHGRQAAIAQSLGMAEEPIRMDSQAKYGAVARGDADLYLRLPQPASGDRRENIWDHAAGAIVIEEAGGRVTDLFGQPLDFSHGSKLSQNQGIVASNGHIHDRVLAAIRDR